MPNIIPISLDISNLPDYSKENMLTKLYEIAKSFFSETLSGINAISVNDNWFFKKVLEKNILYLYNIADGTDIPLDELFNGLMFAYSHPGSTKALHELCKSLFGDQSVVLMTISPGAYNVDVSNTNRKFLKAIVSDQNKWIKDSIDDKGITANVFESLGNTDIGSFLEQFLAPGRVLQLNITL